MRSKRLAHSLLNEKNRFSIRKLSIGAASVLIGCTFYLGSSNTVQAADGDSTSGDSKTSEVIPASEETPSGEKAETDSQETLATDSLDVVPGTNDADKAKGKDQEVQPENNSASDEEGKGQEETDQSQTPDEEPNDQENNVSKILDQNKDLKAIYDQVKNNAGYQKDSEQALVPDAVKGAKILPQVAIQGEVPNLDPKAFVNQDMIDTLNNLGVNLLADDPTSVKLSWAQAPDVSKLGQTTGKLKVEYATSYDDDNNPTYSSFVIDVPVDVVAGAKKTEGQVRNTLNVIDADTNLLIYYYTWTGEPNSQTPVSEYYQQIESELNALGYNLADNADRSALYNLGTFSDNDATGVLYVTAVSKNENDEPSIKVNDGKEPHDGMTFQDSAYEYNSDPNHADPAEFIYGLGYLGPTDYVLWGTKPEYKTTLDENGKPTEAEIVNEPSIEIRDKDNNIIKIFSGDTLKETLLNYYKYYINNSRDGIPAVEGKVIIRQGADAPKASSVLTGLPLTDKVITDPDEIKARLDKYYDVIWALAPNTNELGYQVAYIKFNLKYALDSSEQEEAQNTLLSFFAENGDSEENSEEENDNPSMITQNPYAVLVQVVPQNTTSTQYNTQVVTRTIHYEVPAGHDPIADQVQTVTFQQAVTTDLLTGEVTTGNWTPSAGSWSEVSVNQIAGFTSLIDGKAGTIVAANNNVLLNDNNVIVNVTYQQNKQPVQPTQPTKPVQPSKPTEPTEPVQPTKPHHKKNDEKKPEKPTPKPENRKSENDNNAPKGENDSWSDNFRPHAQSLSDETTIDNLPQGYSVKPNGQVVDPAGNVVGYVDRNGVVHFTSELPQTSEKNSNLTKLGLISLGVASIAMLIGLLGDRKRN